MSITKILNSLEKSWERDDILLNLKKGLGTEEIGLSNGNPHNKISSLMIKWSNKFVIIALLTISVIALSKQAWA